LATPRTSPFYAIQPLYYALDARTPEELYSGAGALRDCGVLEFTGLYFTQTRGAFLGFVGGLINRGNLHCMAGRGTEWRTLRRVSYWGLGVIVVLVVAFLRYALRR